MKIKSEAPKEDPETKARRQLEETRAEADKTSALQSMLDRKSRRVLRIFGGRPQTAGASRGFAGAAASGDGGGGSGGSGVPTYDPFSGGYGGFGGTDFGRIAY